MAAPSEGGRGSRRRVCVLAVALALCEHGACFRAPPPGLLPVPAPGALRGCGHRPRAARGPALRPARMTATKPPTGGAAGDEAGALQAQAGEVCFDGGCVVDEDAGLLLDELENELRELSETEQRLRREGAMMVIEKLRSDETLGGRLGSAGGRLGSAGAAAVTVPTFSREAGESVISQRLGGKTGPTVWSEFGALAASLKDKAINLGQGFPNWPPPEFVLNASMTAMMQGSHQYTRTAGHPSLITTLAARYSMHLERDIKPESEGVCARGALAPHPVRALAYINPTLSTLSTNLFTDTPSSSTPQTWTPCTARRTNPVVPKVNPRPNPKP